MTGSTERTRQGPWAPPTMDTGRIDDAAPGMIRRYDAASEPAA